MLITTTEREDRVECRDLPETIGDVCDVFSFLADQLETDCLRNTVDDRDATATHNGILASYVLPLGLGTLSFRKETEDQPAWSVIRIEAPRRRESKRSVVAVGKDAELGRIRLFSDGTWEQVEDEPRHVVAEIQVTATERQRVWSDGARESVSA